MTNEKQKKVTDEYRNNWDAIFKPIIDAIKKFDDKYKEVVQKNREEKHD